MSSRSAVVAVVLAAAVGVGVLLAPKTPMEPLMAPTTATSVTDLTGPEVISIHVAGWVLHPGVVQVPSGSLVADVIAAAGGAVAGARLDLVNLAAPASDGGQIEVPGPGGSAVPDGGATGTGLISLNTADVVALQSLPGVGPVLAERIVAFREANGPFSVVEDLLEVSGIGEAKLAALRDLVSVP